MQVHLSFPAPQKHSVFDLLDLLSALVCICAFAMVVAADYYWPSYEMGSFMSFTASVYFFGVWRKFVGCIVLLETVRCFVSLGLSPYSAWCRGRSIYHECDHHTMTIWTEH